MHMRFEITEHGAPAFPCLHLTKRKTMPCIRRRLVLALTAAAAASLVAAADLTVCSGTGMDWYTDMVGETPCTTYQRLRQICNSQCAYILGVVCAILIFCSRGWNYEREHPTGFLY